MTSQRLVAAAIADGAGAATFTFATCPQQSVITGVVAIPLASTLATSHAYINGLQLAPFLGANPYGPVQVTGGETLTVKSTGLTAGAAYTAVWIADIEPDLPGARSGLPIPYGASTVTVQGTPTFTQQRSDGRTYPLGTNIAGAASGVGTTVIGAPGIGLHLLLRSLALGGPGNAGGGLSLVNVNVTINGNATVIATAQGFAGSANSMAFSWESGILLDANTAVTTTVGGVAITAAYQVGIVYDVVA